MNRFNLTFRGEIIDGHDPAQVQARLAEVLAIEDPAFLQKCFSGDPVVLRRNLERKEAAELYARLHRLGIHAELVRISDDGDLHAGEKQLVEDFPDQSPQSSETPPDSDRTAEQPMTRRADLAVSRALQKKEAAQLRAKEKALKKLLRAKTKEDAKRAKTSQQARARKADHKTRLEADRLKAALAEKKRKKQVQEAKRKAQQKQLEAEAAAKREAEREREESLEQERLAARRAEHERKDLARLAEKRRLAAVKAAKREEEQRKAEEIADRLRVENARRKREQAEAAARQKAEEARKNAEEQAAEAEQLAQRRAMEEQAIQRAAVELAQQPSLKPVEARVRTRLEMPSTQRSSSAGGSRRRHQSGEPNLYSLSPFRNTPAIRARAPQSQRIMRLSFTAAAVALGAALLLYAGQFGLLAPPTPLGASDIAIGPKGQPLLLAGDHLLLHDRAGVGVSTLSLDDLGLAALQGPMAFTATGELLAPGRLVGAEQVEPGSVPGLLRCALAEGHCEPFSAALAGTTISALAVNPMDGNVFIADGPGGKLLKVSPEGEVLARAAMDLPEQPALRLDSGLLMMSSADGPAINIYRYDDEAFGTQLDEVLLTPPTADKNTFTGVRDFLRSGGHWWALLGQAQKDRASLYRFDSRWTLIDAPAVTPGSRPTQLVNWSNRTLVTDQSRIPIQRFNSSGAVETPMVSSVLTELRAGQMRRDKLIKLGWRIALAICLMAVAGSLCLGWLHRARKLVYTSCRGVGAVPVDKLAGSMDWIEPAPDRDTNLRRRGIAYAVIVAALIVVAVTLGISALQLSAMLLALLGPAIALLLFHRSDAGHIGLSDAQLLLVDHEGMYHLGSGSRVHYRGPFLMIDDVTVFTGTRLLPAFDGKGVAERVAPLAAGGVKVDRTILGVKLLQGRHPLALGAAAIATTSASAIALLSLQGIF